MAIDSGKFLPIDPSTGDTRNTEPLREVGAVTEIPRNLTDGKFLFFKNPTFSHDLKGVQNMMMGELKNPPIEVGKEIILSNGRTKKVIKIKQESTAFTITTQDARVWILDPEESGNPPSHPTKK